jgi:prevent-host-death family protein
MATREISIGAFPRSASKLLREVLDTKKPITITRRGVPVAELRPVSVVSETLLGSVTYLDRRLARPLRSRDWEATR